MAKRASKAVPIADDVLLALLAGTAEPGSAPSPEIVEALANMPGAPPGLRKKAKYLIAKMREAGTRRGPSGAALRMGQGVQQVGNVPTPRTMPYEPLTETAIVPYQESLSAKVQRKGAKLSSARLRAAGTATTGSRVIEAGGKLGDRAARSGLKAKQWWKGLGKLGKVGVGVGAALTAWDMVEAFRERGRSEQLDRMIPDVQPGDVLEMIRQEDLLAAREARLVQQDPEAYRTLQGLMRAKQKTGGYGRQLTQGQGDEGEIRDLLAALTAG